MRAKAEHRFAVLAVALLICTGCKATHQCGEPSVAPAQVWPDRIMGLQRQHVTSSYVLYGNAVDTADQLRKWIDEELTAFRCRHDYASNGQGLVLALESDLPPASTLASWHREHMRRLRLIVWTSPIRKQFIMRTTGRPYCLEDVPYFCESFSIPYEDAMQIGLLTGQMPRPEWICFLSTESQVKAAFDARLQQLKKECRQRRKHVPGIVLLLNFWVPPLYYVMGELFVYPKWREIDVKLMELQRRETLWSVLIAGSFRDDDAKRKKLRLLEIETDEQWQELWFRRPFD